MSLLDSTQLALESAMTGSALRQTLLTNNLANANTPGYKPQDVNFQGTLANALASGQSPSAIQYTPYTVQSTVSADGNGVNAEQTSAELASNGLLYESLSAVAAQREQILLYAIGGPGA
ncbi:MAG: flagellar basal body rod protein FlgB [Solirubrobacteraceae bacterium]